MLLSFVLVDLNGIQKGSATSGLFNNVLKFAPTRQVVQSPAGTFLELRVVREGVHCGND